MEPATKNKMPVIRPWATMPKMAALMPKVVSVEMASITKPMCDTEEKAMSRFMSVWARQHERAVDDADHRPAARSTGAHVWAALGRMGRAMRMKP